jgi:putative restriction endonuclease
MRNNWTREELVLAFNLYCKLPYGQFNNRNADIKTLADLIKRTPGAVAYKLVNFVSLDPKQKLLGRKGATNIGKLDKVIFQEFTENFDEMFYESEDLLLTKIEEDKPKPNIEKLIDENKKGEYKIRETKVRINQDYFRTIVMSNYTNGCGITGISVPEVLVASHIKPWSSDEKNRLNPANGICLSATFDKAFDKGLITIDNNFKIVFSSKLKKYLKEDFYKNEFERFENRQLNLPIKFLPNDEFLEYHFDVVFKK